MLFIPQANLDARNISSAKLCSSIGIRQEVRCIKDYWNKGEWTDSFVYGMLTIESITTDNGSEFALLPKLESYGIEVYYAHAYHSWEKGSNERHNRMLREIYPKGTDFNEVKESEIQRSVSVINQRPRQILDYSTPIEKYNMKGK